MSIRERFIELRRAENRFVAAPDADLNEADVFDEDWYRDYVSRHCRREEHTVELNGSSTKKTIFVSQDDETIGFFLQQEEAIGNFALQPHHNSFFAQHVKKYASSETFYEPYQLLVRSQTIQTPILRILKNASSFSNSTEAAAEEEILDSHYSIIIGAPGSGKTTLIRNLAQRMAERRRSAQTDQVPIIISLRRFEYEGFNTQSLHHYLRSNESDEISDAVCENLETGTFRFFLDGLDEVLFKRRDLIYASIQAFAESYPRNSYTITARDSVFDQIPSHTDIFRIGEWDDFLIKRWCYENLSDQNSWKSFYSHIVQNTESKNLFRNPLMLNLAAYLFEKYDTLPHRKADLFFNVINTITDDWDRARGIRRSVGFWKSPRHKISILSYLAFQQCLSGSDVVREDVIQKWIGEKTSSPPAETCRALAVETGLLSEVAAGEWMFIHRSIQEYLAALFVADSSLPPLTLLEHFLPDQKNRILAYLSNMVSDNNQFIESVVDEKGLREKDKAEIVTTALSEGMEIDSKIKKRVYALIGDYLKYKFEFAIKLELKSKKLSIRTETSASAKAMAEALYLVASLSRTKFSEELRDIAKAVLPKTAFALVSFVLGSSAFFITKITNLGEIEARNETKRDFTEE